MGGWGRGIGKVPGKKFSHTCSPTTHPIHLSPFTYSPVGVFEFDKFAAGSKQVLEAVVEATDKGAVTVLGK